MATKSNAMADEADARRYHLMDPRVQEGTGDRGNERVAVTLFAELSPEQLIVSTACQPEFTTLFQTCAPDWNRLFHWRGVGPRADEHGSQALQSLIQSSFTKSGHDTGNPTVADPMPTMYRWTWLALNGVQLKVVAGNPDVRQTSDPATCQLAIDQWRAAYFLDFGNQPHSRLRQMLDRLMHWRFSLGLRVVCTE